MDKKGLEQLQENIKLANKAAKQLDNQIKNLENIFKATIESAEVSPEEKQKIRELNALTNRAINLAKKGGNYQEVIEQIKTKFSK